ncbi:unnamed protein product [Arabidopsis lyrata]|uniref:Predicted protein n=1 Tax=Arabidopsis lyrata subsp. lyrata TaxID=81972 RepID=D7KHP4_ARALL|nr:predicted protein [Arabidopsis lyrata subsp. lyrata]CAH8255262.1 unnamed protein product [Arabidopsis lyrata]
MKGLQKLAGEELESEGNYTNSPEKNESDKVFESPVKKSDPVTDGVVGGDGVVEGDDKGRGRRRKSRSTAKVEVDGVVKFFEGEVCWKRNRRVWKK